MPEYFFVMNVEPIRSLLSSARKILITTHFKPDGDAMGSSLGLYNYLIQKSHDVTVVVPSDYPEFLQWMAGNETVLEFEKDLPRSMKLIEEAEVIFCLDFNRLHRCEGLAPHIQKSKAKKIIIDHHLEPEQFCDYEFLVPGASSTSELIYDFIIAFGDEEHITKSVAECLYAGIMTDTASFRFSTMKAETHRVIASLIEKGAENFRIHEAIYDCWSEQRIRLLAYSLNDKMKVLPEYNTAMIELSREEMNRFNHKTGDTEGIVNIPLSIKNIRLSVFFVQRKNEIKISFRSKDDFNVRDLSAKYFEGGGHKNAAGGKSDKSMEETVAKFISILPEYKHELVS